MLETIGSKSIDLKYERHRMQAYTATVTDYNVDETNGISQRRAVMFVCKIILY